MTLVVLIGGARSGKSDLALRLASEQEAPVVFVATAEAGDAEMTKRIEKHRQERPSHWRTIEEPVKLDGAIKSAGKVDCLVVDCLTVWTLNAMEQLGVADAEAEALSSSAAASARPGLTIVVTNEVGLGLVPNSALGRGYRDLLGRVNVIWAAAADHVLLLVAGQMLRLENTGGLGERPW